MKSLIVFFGFISLTLLGCGGGRRVARPPAPPPPQTTPPQAPKVPPSMNCKYLGSHQIVGDQSCSKRFCYTWSWCQGREPNIFLFCEATLDAEGNYSCPTASDCAAAETVPSNPMLAIHLWRNNCDSGGGDYYYESEEEEPGFWSRFFGGGKDEEEDDDDESSYVRPEGVDNR